MIDPATRIATYDTPDGIFIQTEHSGEQMRLVSRILDGMKVKPNASFLEFSTDLETLAPMFNAILKRKDGVEFTLDAGDVGRWPWDRIIVQVIQDFFVFAPTLTSFINTFAGAMLSSEMRTAASAAGKAPSTGSISD
jgi:hypothetical protein